MPSTIYRYTYNENDNSENAPEELHNIFMNELVACVMGSEFITKVELGLGDLVIHLNVNSIKTKYFSPPNVSNALGKHFKTLTITSDSYSFDTANTVIFSEQDRVSSSYKSMIAILKYSVKDLNNFENEIRDSLMSIDNFILHSSDIIEKILPYKKYPELLRFSVSEKTLRLAFISDLRQFPIEKTVEKLTDVKTSISFFRGEDCGRMKAFNPYDTIIDDIFRKRYLRDDEWPYILFSELETTCNTIKSVFDKNRKNYKKYKNLLS